MKRDRYAISPINRLKRENLSNFFNRYINSVLVKIILILSILQCDKMQKEKSQMSYKQTILQKSPQHRNLCSSTSAFRTPFFLPPSFITETVLSPSILLPNPFPRLYGTRGFVSAILYRPISIRIDPPDREGGGRFLQRPGVRHIFAGEHQSQSVTKRFLIEPLSRLIPRFLPFFNLISINSSSPDFTHKKEKEKEKEIFFRIVNLNSYLRLL